MTKFVAAFFLPAIAVVALFWGGPGVSRLRTHWRDLLVAAVLVAGLGSPWFIYHSMDRSAGEFWHVLVGVHVLTRFTTYVDPAHVHPWHYYVTATWRELGRSGSQLLVGLGLLRLLLAIVRRESWLARLIAVWAVLPLAAISFGSSKLLHYAYPFWPPIALAAGFAAAALLQLDVTSASVVPSLRGWWTAERQTRTMLVVRVAGVFGLVLLLPTRAYVAELNETQLVDHPLRAVSECMGSIRQAQIPTGSGVYVASGNVLHHAYYFYFRRQGLWTIELPAFSKQDVVDRLRTAGQQMPVILLRRDYERLYKPFVPTAGPTGGPPDRAEPVAAEGLTWSQADGVAVADDTAMLLPGPYARCVQPALDAGAHPLWRPASAPAP